MYVQTEYIIKDAIFFFEYYVSLILNLCSGGFPHQAWSRRQSAWWRRTTANSTDSCSLQVHSESTLPASQAQHSPQPFSFQDLHYTEEPQRSRDSKRDTNPAETDCTFPTAAHTSTNTSANPCTNSRHPGHPKQAEHGGGDPKSGRQHCYHQGRTADSARPRSRPCNSNRSTSLDRSCKVGKPKWKASIAYDCSSQSWSAVNRSNTNSATSKGANSASATTRANATAAKRTFPSAKSHGDRAASSDAARPADNSAGLARGAVGATAACGNSAAGEAAAVEAAEYCQATRQGSTHKGHSSAVWAKHKEGGARCSKPCSSAGAPSSPPCPTSAACTSSSNCPSAKSGLTNSTRVDNTKQSQRDSAQPVNFARVSDQARSFCGEGWKKGAGAATGRPGSSPSLSCFPGCQHCHLVHQPVLALTVPHLTEQAVAWTALPHPQHHPPSCSWA